MKLKLSAEQIRETLEIEPPDFPKYTTQLLNLANQNAQGTRPSVVGQLSDLIQQFKGNDLEEWESWYLERHPDAVQKATERVLLMVSNLRDAISKIDRDLVEMWVKDLVIVKTFVGLKFQRAVLKVLAEKEGKSWRLAEAAEESKGIDGFVGERPVSIKPHTYKAKQSLPESIAVRIIYYEKVKDGIEIEYE